MQRSDNLGFACKTDLMRRSQMNAMQDRVHRSSLRCQQRRSARHAVVAGLSLFALAFLLALCPPAGAAERPDPPVPKGRVAWLLEGAVDRAGSRFRQQGQERWTGSVELRDSKGTVLKSSIGTVMEWPGKLALDSGSGKIVFAPGVAKTVGLEEMSALVAEVLLEDTLDGFLAQHFSGSSVRIAGTGYPDPNRIGATHSVVTLRSPSRTKEGAQIRAKQYWFDVATNQLVRVIHPEAGVEVRLGDYSTFNGNEFPKTITLLERGSPKYVFTVAIGLVSQKVNDGMFEGN